MFGMSGQKLPEISPTVSVAENQRDEEGLWSVVHRDKDEIRRFISKTFQI